MKRLLIYVSIISLSTIPFVLLHDSPEVGDKISRYENLFSSVSAPSNVKDNRILSKMNVRTTEKASDSSVQAESEGRQMAIEIGKLVEKVVTLGSDLQEIVDLVIEYSEKYPEFIDSIKSSVIDAYMFAAEIHDAKSKEILERLIVERFPAEVEDKCLRFISALMNNLSDEELFRVVVSCKKSSNIQDIASHICGEIYRKKGRAMGIKQYNDLRILLPNLTPVDQVIR